MANSSQNWSTWCDRQQNYVADNRRKAFDGQDEIAARLWAAPETEGAVPEDGAIQPVDVDEKTPPPATEMVLLPIRRSEDELLVDIRRHVPSGTFVPTPTGYGPGSPRQERERRERKRRVALFRELEEKMAMYTNDPWELERAMEGEEDLV